jgi:CRP/FNR family transcriptional regulator, anaerobic regulatory protein
MNQQILDKLNEHFSKYDLKSYAKGEILTLANHEPEGVLLLVSGLVEQYDITPGGNNLIVNIFKPPAFFPMSWAINHARNTYFYGALTDVELRQADADETVVFLKANPDVMFDLLSRVYKGTDALLRRLVVATSGAAVSRLMFELVIEAYRFGVEVDNKTVLIKLRQTALADRSGLARETVSRELRKLEQENLISRSKQGLVIDIKNLEHRLGFEI